MAETTKVNGEDTFEAATIPIEAVVIDYAFNIHPERSQDPVLVEGMMQDIQDKGLLQPLVVHADVERLPRADADGNVFRTRYFLMAGFIRYEALKRLGWKRIPVTIKRGLNEIEKLGVNGAENTRRNQVHPFFIARRWKYLRDRGQSNAEIARAHGYTATYVGNLISTYVATPDDLKEKAFKGAVLNQEPPTVSWLIGQRHKTPDEIRKAYEEKYGSGKAARDLSEADDGDPEVAEVKKRPRSRNRDDILRLRAVHLQPEAGLTVALKGFQGKDAELSKRERVLIKATLDWVLDARKPLPFHLPAKKKPEIDESSLTDDEGQA